MQLPELGDTFIGRYQISQILGEGAFARVFRARDLELPRDVALKVLAPRQGAYSQLSSARFLRESRVLATLQNPHSVTLFDFGQSPEGLLWAAFEFVEGRDLAACLRTEKALPPSVVAHILEQCLSALHEAHQRTVVHRDIKPANIFVYTYQGDQWRVKLLDFGLAKPTNADATQLTGEGKTAGTPRYMAPEQVLALEVGPPADIYSLGLVAYELLTGSPAIDGDNMKELLRGHLDGPPVTVSPDLAPHSLRAVVDRMCIRELGERYPNAAVVLRDLHAARRELSSGFARTQQWSSSSVPSTSATSPSPANQNESRSLGFLILAVLAVFLVGGIMVAALLPTSPPPEPRPLPTALTVTPADRRTETVPDQMDAGVSGVSSERESATICDRGESGFREVTWAFGDHEVGLLVYVPHSLEPAHAAPLIAGFKPNSTVSARSWLDYMQLVELAEEHQVLLVVPETKLLTFPFGPSWIRIAMDGAWDGILGMQEELCADRSQLFLLGEVNGSEAVDALICEQARFITAAASSANRYRADADHCRPSQPVPYLHFDHLQRTVKSEPGCPKGDRVASLAQQRTRFRDQQGCSQAAPRIASHNDGRCLEYTCDVPFVTCEVNGGRHWHGPLPARYVRIPCMGKRTEFPYREVLWAFFEKHGDLR